MMDPEMCTALNKQINEEIFSAYLYASMASFFEDIHLKGFAQWMEANAAEELAHAKKIVTYVQDRGARVTYTAIATPQAEWESPLAALEDAYSHECHISSCINKLATMASDKNDHATSALLDWFVTEQVEEEAVTDDMVQQLKLTEGAPGGLFLLDSRLLSTPPSPA